MFFHVQHVINEIESDHLFQSSNARSTVARLVVRDQAHENGYARALETLGVDRGRPQATAEMELNTPPGAYGPQ